MKNIEVSMSLIITAGDIKCDETGDCIYCEYHDYCHALFNTYHEATKIIGDNNEHNT